jgi:hypothetical protein
MTAKYNRDAMDAATHPAGVRARVTGDNYACGATAWNSMADIGVIGPCPAHMTGLL